MQREAGMGCVYLEDCGEECGNKSSCVAAVETYTLDAELIEIMRNETQICEHLEHIRTEMAGRYSRRRLHDDDPNYWELDQKVCAIPTSLVRAAGSLVPGQRTLHVSS
jgi:hypothetical protein